MGSSCQDQIQSSDLSGTRFVFEFEVTSIAANVQIKFYDVCGVDYDSNVMVLERDGEIYASSYLSPSDVQEIPSLSLSQGKYQLIVEAGGREIGAGAFDVDDFLIGRVQISSNQTLKKGEVRVENRASRPHKTTFGLDKDYAFGDGGGDVIACSNESGQSSEAGRTFEFRFEVPAPGAVVQIGPADHCDLSFTTNEFMLAAGSQSLLYRRLFNESWAFPSLNLAAGTYGIQIRSNPELQGDDLDDFLIRRLVVWSSVPLVNPQTFRLE